MASLYSRIHNTHRTVNYCRLSSRPADGQNTARLPGQHHKPGRHIYRGTLPGEHPPTARNVQYLIEPSQPRNFGDFSSFQPVIEFCEGRCRSLKCYETSTKPNSTRSASNLHAAARSNEQNARNNPQCLPIDREGVCSILHVLIGKP